MRVFLDTNVLVSALATRGLCTDVVRIVLADRELVTSEIILTELRRVFTGKLTLPERRIDDVIEFLRRYQVEPRPKAGAPEPLREPDDALVLASAISAGADVLVTGDRDLLVVREQISSIRIVDPRGFWAAVRGERA